MDSDHNLIYENYKKVINENLGLGAPLEGLGSPIDTRIHTTSELHVPKKHCHCSHGTPCEQCEECVSTIECDGCQEDLTPEFTEIAKQQLYRIHKLSELLHELIDNHAFKPWMATKITRASEDLGSIYDKVDYEVSVKSAPDVE